MKKCRKYYGKPTKTTNEIDLLQDYKNIINKVKDYIITELKKRYWDIEIIDNDDEFLLCFRIDIWDFEINLVNNYISIIVNTNNICFEEAHYDNKLEDFDELFKYIDDIINKEN